MYLGESVVKQINHLALLISLLGLCKRHNLVRKLLPKKKKKHSQAVKTLYKYRIYHDSLALLLCTRDKYMHYIYLLVVIRFCASHLEISNLILLIDAKLFNHEK